MDLTHAVRWAAERYPDRCAVGGPHPLSYADWDARTDALAHALLMIGARPGSRVALCMAGGEPLASLHLAAQKIAVTSVPLSTRLAPAELGYCLADCNPVAVVVDATTHDLVSAAIDAMASPPKIAVYGADAPPGADSVEELLRRAPLGAPLFGAVESDVSVMLYTSGTTGRPKGVPRSHAAEHAAAVAHLVQTGHAPGDVTLGVMPMFHTMGLRTLLASVIAGGTWVPQATFDAEQCLTLIDREQISTLYLVPTIYWSLAETGRLSELHSVRRIAYAGAAMSPSLVQRLQAEIEPERFVNHFGSTEIYTFSVAPAAALKPGSAGRAGVFSRLRIVDPSPDARPTDEVSVGEEGEVAVSLESPEAFAGYWNRPDANAKSIRNGWYFTGDLAHHDEDGDLWISGRVDDMINSGGENVYPDEIERVLAGCRGVAEVVVSATPSDRWGHAVTAFVVPPPGVHPDDAILALERFIRDGSGLPSLKRPKRIIAITAVPKSPVGKILRRKLTAGEYDRLAVREVPSGSPPAEAREAHR
ncbi:MAG: 2-furoate---CoA ligase [Pseudonocardiales bacterium]|jgi:2-furoate---CoA ligase|nr:2-furoate---CoA ligase [Pseudonocardiales bacterium]